jgi:hypothetical protein
MMVDLFGTMTNNREDTFIIKFIIINTLRNIDIYNYI